MYNKQNQLGDSFYIENSSMSLDQLKQWHLHLLYITMISSAKPEHIHINSYVNVQK